VTPRERVLAAFAHHQPDFTPCDYFATPEIHGALLEHFSVSEDAELRDRLGTDISYVAPPYVGPQLPAFDDGSRQDIWGIRRRPMPNQYGQYAEPVGLPYAKWKTVADTDDYPWPNPDWFDYAAIGPICERFPQVAIAAGSFHVQDFINSVSMGRGVEQVLIDMAVEEPVFLSIVDRRQRFYVEHIERILEAAAGRIDLVLCGDDFGTQRGLMISPDTFRRLFGPKKKEFFDLVHSYGAKVTHHCCGSSRQLIPDFIESGMDALQTIQPQAQGMNPYELKREFNGRIVLHGAVDVQGWLQRSSPAQIEAEVDRLMDEVGRDGGLVLAPCHHIQPDTPIENVLALYGAVARRRGKELGR
jgi:uroporphyrinogen decarboxylase